MPVLLRSAAPLAALLITAALVAGCSAGKPAAVVTVTVTSTAGARPTTPASTPSSSTAAPTGPGPCQGPALKVTLGPGSAAAGTAYYPIRFTNISHSSCTLYGFPGVSFTGETYAVQVGPAAVRNHRSAEHLVTLAPGGVASAQIRVANADNLTAACGQTTASGILVYPPNLTTSTGLPFNGMTCANSKYPTLTVNAVVAGPGS